MLTIEQFSNEQIAIKCDYFYLKRIKKCIPNAIFDYNIKKWITKISNIPYLEKDFAGEIFYKTPKWKLLNEPKPDYKNDYYIIDNNLKCPELKLPPYNYQSYAIKYMIDKINKNNFVINGSDVGLGKTIMTIGTLKWFIENKNFKKILICCKKTIKQQWINEINLFTDLQNDFVLLKTSDSTRKKRLKVYNEAKNSDKVILVTNHHNFLNDTLDIKQIDFDIVVIDEVHELKSRTGIKNLNMQKVCLNKPTIFLTGTPIMSKPSDIYGIVQITNPNYFGDWKSFEKNFLVIDYKSKYGEKVVGAKNLNILRNKIRDILIRFTENEVDIELPETKIIKISCPKDDIQNKMDEKLKEISRHFSEELEKTLDSNTKSVKPEFVEIHDKIEAVLKGYISIGQAIANDPMLMKRTKSYLVVKDFLPMLSKNYELSSKTEATLDIIENIMNNNKKVVIFSKFEASVNYLRDVIENKLKYKVLLYTGSVNQEQRDINIEKFKTDDEYNIIIGTEALSTGLNLQIAKYIINYDQPDTYAIKVQRTGRIRRVKSQYKNIFIYDMITEDSKDEERLINIENNKSLVDNLVTSTDEESNILKNVYKSVS